jgi:hypothetical protein
MGTRGLATVGVAVGGEQEANRQRDQGHEASHDVSSSSDLTLRHVDSVRNNGDLTGTGDRLRRSERGPGRGQTDEHDDQRDDPSDIAGRPIADWIRANGKIVDPARWRPRASDRWRDMRLYDLRPDAGLVAGASAE